MTTGLWVLLGALLLGTALGVLHKLRQGRISAAKRVTESASTESASAESTPATSAAPGAGLPPEVRDVVFGGDADAADGVVLLQLSTTICAPCRQARVILADLAAHTDGVRHVEFDLTPQPAVAERLRVMRTPTTLALDPDGHELFRVHGVPRKDRLLAALEPHLGAGA